MGHATRCIPIIQYFLAKNNNVIIAADKYPLALLEQEFPNLDTILFKGYEINYPNNKNMVFKMLLESPKIIKRIKQEHIELAKIIDEYKIDLVISDNRYGLWSKKIPCIFITHQLFIKAPFGEKILKKITEKYINKFTKCWIPDYKEENNLSGDLSHQYPLAKNHYQFIGVLSRFKQQGTSITNLKTAYDVIAIISGPEPQRTIFEGLILHQLQGVDLKSVIVRGLPKQALKTQYQTSNIEMFNHLPTDKLYQYIQKSKVIVCRAGYSSIMDLAILNKKAILIPTPGQTEQEYLAKYHFKKSNFYTQQQSEFNLKKALLNVENFSLKDFKSSALDLDF